MDEEELKSKILGYFSKGWKIEVDPNSYNYYLTSPTEWLFPENCLRNYCALCDEPNAPK